MKSRSPDSGSDEDRVPVETYQCVFDGKDKEKRRTIFEQAYNNICNLADSILYMKPGELLGMIFAVLFAIFILIIQIGSPFPIF